MTVHFLKVTQDGIVTAGCGETAKYKGKQPSNFTVWNSEVTCPPCSARSLFHESFTKESLLTKITELQDRSQVRTFHFTGKRWWFRWPIGFPTVYIFQGEEGKYAMAALPVIPPETWHHEDGSVREDHMDAQEGDWYGQGDVTYEMVQTVAREWIKTHDNNYVFPASTTPPAPKKAPAGPHCAVCLKKDEGDLLDYPGNDGKLICMVDFVKQSRK